MDSSVVRSYYVFKIYKRERRKIMADRNKYGNYVNEKEVTIKITAPIIVEAINQNKECYEIYQAIYYRVIKECVDAINKGDYDFAYQRYKDSILELEELYARPILEQRLVLSLKRK